MKNSAARSRPRKQRDRAGSRGGTLPPHTVESAQASFESSREDEFFTIQTHILTLAAEHGEYHADMLANFVVSEANMIGAAVNSLAKRGFLEKLNRDGEVEHRKGTSPACHGRLSYVWRLTDEGLNLVMPS